MENIKRAIVIVVLVLLSFSTILAMIRGADVPVGIAGMLVSILGFVFGSNVLSSKQGKPVLDDSPFPKDKEETDGY